MTMDGLVLTIFTPTFNRERLLPRLYASLREVLATYKGRVEWLVVDDGSTDQTVNVVESIVAESEGTIRLVTTENGGKHRAINVAHEARGAWVMILDSDDWLERDVMPDILDTIHHVDSDRRVAVIRAFRRFTDRKTPLGFGVSRQPAHHFEWLDRKDVFDTAEIVRAEALRLFPFPDFVGEKFMAESWLWNSLDSQYMTWFVERPWIVCEYQPEGLSAKSVALRIRCPMGAMATYASTYQNSRSAKRRMKAAINWWRFRLHGRGRPDPRCGRVPIIYSAAGLVMYLRDVRA